MKSTAAPFHTMPCTTRLLADWLRKKAEAREARIRAAVIKANGGAMPTLHDVAGRATAKWHTDRKNEWFWDGKLILTETPEGEFIEP